VLGRMLAIGLVGLGGGRVMLVDEATGEEKWAVQAHSAGGTHQTPQVAMSPGNGRFVVSVGGNDEHWKLWDAASGELHRVGATHDGTGACICVFNNLGRRVLQEGCPVVAHTAKVTTVAFSPCGQSLATGGWDGAVIIWDVETGEAHQRMQGNVVSALSLSFSGEGAFLACGNCDGSIHVWDAMDPFGIVLRTIPKVYEYLVESVEFSPTDSLTLASGGDYHIHLWDIDSGEKIRSFRACTFAAFSQDGRSIATTNSDPNSDGHSREVHVVDAESGALRLRLFGHLQRVSCATFSVDDGSKIASGSNDGACKVWDSSTGALLRTINVGTRVTSLSFGRDWMRDLKCSFAMGHHPRLGTASQVLELEVGVVRMILDRV